VSEDYSIELLKLKKKSSQHILLDSGVILSGIAYHLFCTYFEVIEIKVKLQADAKYLHISSPLPPKT
jgi:hypothetical protein